MFVNEHEQPNIVEDCKRFLKTMKELKLYMVKFKKDSTIKNKKYPLDCAVNGKIRQPIIIIIHNKCSFSENDGICKA